MIVQFPSILSLRKQTTEHRLHSSVLQSVFVGLLQVLFRWVWQRASTQFIWDLGQWKKKTTKKKAVCERCHTHTHTHTRTHARTHTLESSKWVIRPSFRAAVGFQPVFSVTQRTNCRSPIHRKRRTCTLEGTDLLCHVCRHLWFTLELYFFCQGTQNTSHFPWSFAQ